MKELTSYLKKQSWFTSFRTSFLSNPNRLPSVKATFVIGVLVILMVSLNLPFYAVTLGLGALAGALSETDDHPKGR